MGATNYPVPRQQREHGRIPKAHERKSQKETTTAKKSSTHLLGEFKYLCNVIKNNKIPAKQRLSYKGNLRSAAS